MVFFLCLTWVELCAGERMEGGVGFVSLTGGRIGLRRGRREVGRCRSGVVGLRMWVPAQIFEFAMDTRVLVPSVVVLSFAASTGWFEYGPRQRGRRGVESESVTFVLRVVNGGKGALVEFPDGTACSIGSGDNLIKAKSAEEVFALTNSLEAKLGSSLKYDVLRVGSSGVRLVRSYPTSVNAEGGKWTANSTVKDMDRIWAHFFELFLDEVDLKWINHKEKLKLVRINDTSNECRLCGGTGTVVCSRCRGADLECRTCSDQRRIPCGWCQSNTFSLETGSRRAT